MKITDYSILLHPIRNKVTFIMLAAFAGWPLLYGMVKLRFHDPAGYLKYLLTSEWFGYKGWVLVVGLLLALEASNLFLALIGYLFGVGKRAVKRFQWVLWGGLLIIFIHDFFLI